MNSKVLSLMGFATRSRNLVSGVNTCSFNINRKKVKLVILAEDISEGSEKKIMKDIRKYNVDFVKYGKAEDLSHATGAEGRTVFAILDQQFAGAIRSEIEKDTE